MSVINNEVTMSSKEPIETAPDAATEPTPDSATTPTPEAKPAPSPKPRPVPKPGAFKAPSPASVAAHATHPVKVPVVADVSDEERQAAAAFGSVADDVVSVTEGAETHEVGPAQGDEPLAPYVRAYFELKASVERFAARLTAAELSIKDIDDTLGSIRAALAEPKVVGDLAALRTEFAPVEADAVAAREALSAERAKARAEALERREQIVCRAEEIAAAPAASIHWKNDTTELRSLLVIRTRPSIVIRNSPAFRWRSWSSPSFVTTVSSTFQGITRAVPYNTDRGSVASRRAHPSRFSSATNCCRESVGSAN